MEIRSARVEDDAIIRDITYSAFLNHPHHIVGAVPTEHLIIDRLRESGALTLSLVALLNNNICGAIIASPVTVNGRAGGIIGIGPLAVAQSYQRRGVGSALIEHCIEALDRLDVAAIVVLGDARLYGRFGFNPDPRLRLGGVPPEYFMTLPLSDDLPEGEVAYHAAFT